MAGAKPAPSREAKVRAKSQGVVIQTRKAGPRLGNWSMRRPGTLVAADWRDDAAGLTLDQIEESLKQG